ncbi:MAG: AraC family transcriptional regulator [Myxococcota bacterium]
MSEDVVEEIVEAEGICVGRFWCPPESGLWRRENRIERGPSFVVPMTGVEIAPAGERPLVTSAARVMFYNSDATYRRRLLSPVGDRCVFVGLTDDAVREVLEAHGVEPGGRASETFRWSWGPLGSRTFLGAQALFRRAFRGMDAEVLREGALALFDAAVAAAEALHRGRDPQPLGPRARDAVDETLRHLVRTPDDRSTLAELGARVDLSPYHLARSFRAATGWSVHACREAIRVACAVERLGSRERLVDIAFDVGYSSHSHLTQAFHRVLGDSPSGVRRKLLAESSVA